MSAATGEPLAIIAGGGPLPLHVAAAALRSGRPVFVAGIEGEADSGIAAFRHAWLGWGQIGGLMRMLEAEGAREVVLVGSIRARPDFTRLKLDLATMAIAKDIIAIAVGGDDTVLSGAVRLLEKRGLRVVGAHEIAADLVAEPGVFGAVRPGRGIVADIAAAMRAARTIGLLDAGQAAVVVNAHAVALEGSEGTDAMLERVRRLREDKRVSWRGRAGVLGKCAKPQQDLRVDMPTIGPRTVELAAAAGLAGIAIEARRVMIYDRAETIRRADAAGLFLIGEAVSDGPP